MILEFIPHVILTVQYSVVQKKTVAYSVNCKIDNKNFIYFVKLMVSVPFREYLSRNHIYATFLVNTTLQDAWAIKDISQNLWLCVDVLYILLAYIH